MSAATLQLPRIAPNWRTPALAVFALLVLLLLSFRDTAVAMVEIWSRSETFTHAYVVPPIVAWLIWRRRAELSTLSPRPAPWMAVPMASAVSVLVMLCTQMGCPDPTEMVPTLTETVGLRIPSV